MSATVRILLQLEPFPELEVGTAEGDDRLQLRRAVARRLRQLATQIDSEGVPEDAARPLLGRGKRLS